MEKAKTKELPSDFGVDRSAVAKGRQYEGLVAEYLQEKGYTIRERNFRCRYGEVDLIAEKGSTLFFVEVKGQKKDWQSEQKVNTDKKKRIEKAAVEYIRRFELWEHGVHFDVAIVTGKTITYYKQAFEGAGTWL